MEIYGKPLEHLWENDGFGTEPASCHRYSMCFPCIFTGFPHVTMQSVGINIRKTYGVPTTGH